MLSKLLVLRTQVISQATKYRELFSPQARHRLQRTDKDNGGFLRVPEGSVFVANTPYKELFWKLIMANLLI